jgi:hypothetical protein
MSDLFFNKRKTIFDMLDESDDLNIIKEAPEDGEGNADAGADDSAPAEDTSNDTGDDNADTGDDTNNDDAGGDEDMGNDEDFDVDTNIGDDDSGDDTDSDTDSDLGDDTGGGDFGGESEEEVNPKNTNIFSTLSAEEQAIKISELKKIYNDLYIYISDMLGKVNDINPNEDNIEAIYRVTSALYSLKSNIADYIKNIFPLKSYIENDVAYNRYLVIIRSITNIMNIIAAEMEEKVQKEEKK